MSLTARDAPLIGSVASFDQATGWGVVRTGDSDDYAFHCTAIADGTRTIATGIAVTFHLTPGHGGQWEAAGIIPR